MAKQFATIMPDLKPAAWIVSSKDKGRKSIKNGKVFLNDGDEFEIEIWNPLQVCVLADIKLNSQSLSKTGLVVKPGQRIYLDCFIDDKKKFVFKTYEVEKSDEASKAIENNGLLEVFFYKEDVISLDNWKPRFDRLIVEKWYPVYYPKYYPTYNPIIWYNTTSPTLVNTNLTGTSFTTSGNNFISSGITTTNACYSSNSGTYTSNVSNLNVGGSITTNTTPINSSIETGRVEKGNKSKQTFTEIDMDFENHYISSTIIQILPESRKPAEIQQVKGKMNKVMAKDILKRESDDVIELIKKLADLHTAGILTDEEFASKKAELLSKI